MKAGFSLDAAALVSVLALFASQSASASSETVLYNFAYPGGVLGQVQEDSSGNLYGTTYRGYGTAYQLQQRQGKWSKNNIHVFNGSDGADPRAGLTPNQSTGTFYGVAQTGGSQGQGTIFALSPSGSRWSETTVPSIYPVRTY